MIFDDPTRTRLLGSIEADRLVLLCGAGLSIPAPSRLMSAVQVSRVCYDKYQPIAALPAAMRDDIDQLAGHFYGTGEFESVFVGTLVPWDDLAGESNPGHAAVADFLISGAAVAALSANFDLLIEQWAHRRRVAMRGALDGRQAQNAGGHERPLVKTAPTGTRRSKRSWKGMSWRSPTSAECSGSSVMILCLATKS
jgi:hypothetical protein